MNEILEILITYWKPIVGLLFTIVGFIIAILKKKPVEDILVYIYNFCIEAINDTECFDKVQKLDPQVKLARAVSYVMQKLKVKYPTLDVEHYAKVIESVIESILTTPQKKGDKHA